MRALNIGIFRKNRIGTSPLVYLCASLFLGNLSVFCAPSSGFAIACSGTINLNGNNVLVDSFNSGDPNYSDWNTNWGYGTYDPAKNKDNGNLGTDSDLLNAIQVGNATIYGHVDSGPGGTFGMYSSAT